jgi:hypothetical protein
MLPSGLDVETAAILLLQLSTGISGRAPEITRHKQTQFTLRSTLAYDFEQLLF